MLNLYDTLQRLTLATNEDRLQWRGVGYKGDETWLDHHRIRVSRNFLHLGQRELPLASSLGDPLRKAIRDQYQRTTDRSDRLLQEAIEALPLTTTFVDP